MEYVCPLCKGHKFRDNSAYYMAMIDNKKYYVFEHECFELGCEGVIYVACNSGFEDRRIVSQEDIVKI